MGLHSLNAICHQITHVLYFYLYQYYVTCSTIQNSLQFENELKKVGTFVHLFICSFVSRLTFLASLFIFPFFLVLLFYVFVL